MGIAIQELLAQEFFKDFTVIAGKNGLQKEIQGITSLEAPDCFKWGQGKELVLSSGYVIRQDPECIRRGFREGSIQVISGMMIKRDRYLERIPEDVIELFDEHDIPLISMPFGVPWMDIIRQVNIAVMNRTIRRFQIQNYSPYRVLNQSYKDQKIKKILQAVEVEMNFPAFLYDLGEEKGYYSSANFRRITEQYGLKELDYWEPSVPYTKHTLCDYIHISRYRLLNKNDIDGPRVSWILIPITINNVDLAYFVVMEAREFIDYYDEYAIRIAFLMLQSAYEQIMVTGNMSNIGFENLIHFALTYNEKDIGKLSSQASVQGISMSTPYIYAVFSQNDPGRSARNERDRFAAAFQRSQISSSSRFAFLDENEGIFVFQLSKEDIRKERYIEKLLEKFSRQIEKECEGMILEFGICREARPISEIKKCVQKCQKVLRMGKILFPKKHIWDYEMLGPLTWLDIPEEELQKLLNSYYELMEDEKNIELLRTLKVYLENNMNYSITAEKTYAHINTIRKRIEKINSLIPVDWQNPVSRMKIELLLQFLEL